MSSITDQPTRRRTRKATMRDDLIERLRYEADISDRPGHGGNRRSGDKRGDEHGYASAQSEASHYAAVYTPDGPVEVRIYEKRLLSADKVERDWLAEAMNALAEWRFDALEVGSEEGRSDE